LSGNTTSVIVQGSFFIIGILVQHAEAITGAGVTSIGGSGITTEGFALVVWTAKATKLIPHAAHELCLGMMLVGEEGDDVDCIEHDLIVTYCNAS
ncbi:hypothetical protein KCV07_g471, partial [Aureobasidium melanogenum]